MIEPGQCYPLGATISHGGVNFSVFSRNSTLVELLLFDRVDDSKPACVIALNPTKHRTYHYWHVFVPGLQSGQIYAYRAYGPFDPERGLRFDRQKILLDPYGKAVAVPENYDRIAASRPGENCSVSMKSVVVDLADYDWQGDQPLNRPSANTIIYELHVGGFTRHPNAGLEVDKRGTYAGLIEKIPYLKALNITAVELLPIFQFDEQDSPAGLINYWGYSPVSFFAPHTAYSSRKDATGAVYEFRDMVKALHRAGIEVILDVVYNHTAEGDHTGPTVCYRGLENSAYYILEKDPKLYSNYSGTGNTLKANNPIVRRMIVDSLRYWVSEMHVDGFRFDLASILSRDESGMPLQNPSILWDIESDPLLAGTKLIAEAWDAAGLYHVGSFIGDSWKEWNGRFRDDCRDFLRGANGTVVRFTDRLFGSPAIYGHEEREPEQSINFVTCHDGFTLNDLVSYNIKHNEANLENNRDGTNENRSWNCGFEGPTDDPQIEKLRIRQIKNFLTVTLLSLGVPMISMGDEVRRTQFGNNNAYCQDNLTSWFDWSLVERYSDVRRFVTMLNERRLLRDVDHERWRVSLNRLLREAKVTYHGVRLNQPDWNDDSHSIAFTLELPKERLLLQFIVNAYWEPLTFELRQALSGSTIEWRRWIDTALDSPQDINRWDTAPIVPGCNYRAESRSVVVLFAPKLIET
jgi:glycogen operon protein